MSQLFEKTSWLPAPPDDFSAQCKSLATIEAGAGALAQRLATYALNANQCTIFGRTLKKRLKVDRELAPLSPFKLGIVSNSTVDLLLDCLPAAAARHGVLLDLVTTPYDQVHQQAFDRASIVNAAGCDGILLMLDHRWFQLDKPQLEGGASRVDQAASMLQEVVEALRDASGASIILPTLAIPPDPLFGSFDLCVPGTVRSSILDLNDRIRTIAQKAGAAVIDIASVAERVGTDAWFDPVQWSAYKLSFAASLNPGVADIVGRLLGAMRGKARKCLVLDLDNTLWGGVIGDDGIEGIKIGQGSARGEAFLSVQRMALSLRERGVMLAVCSKNEDATARRPFREHPDMLLRESDISVFQANWLDKPSNLEAIARTLNIGLDALVFLDDNPAERAQVRAALPQVAVPELPNDANLYARTLSAAGYFEAIAFSREDMLRVESYTSDAKRAEVMTKSRDLGDYLAALEMVLTVGPFDYPGRKRIAQLINKTNQFNLTTRRYTEAEVAAFEEDPRTFTLQVRLRDKFGDLGMIAVAICTPEEGQAKTWHVDTWLMSCRVLGRKVEEAMLGEVVRAAREAGVERITARYVPTAKNDMVCELFDRLGFNLLKRGDDKSAFYDLSVSGFTPADVPMEISREKEAAYS